MPNIAEFPGHIGRRICGNDDPDIRLAVDQGTLLLQPVKFGIVCRHRQERTLLFALAFDCGLANRKSTFKILNSGIPATLFTNLVYKINNLKVYAVKTSNFCRDLPAILR